MAFSHHPEEGKVFTWPEDTSYRNLGDQKVFPHVGEGNGTPLQYSCLANPMDGGAWWAAQSMGSLRVKRLSDFTFTFHFHALEKEMATYSSVLAWRIPGTGQPGGLPTVGSHRVGHNWSDLAAAAAAILHCVYVPQLSYPFICWWTSRLPIIQSELSQKEKHQYSILTYIYGI